MTHQHLSAPRALVVQTILPHYRLPFFRRLCESEDAEFAIAFGDARPSDSLQTVGDTSGVRARRLQNRYVLSVWNGGSLRLQSGAPGPIPRREADMVVAERDPRCRSTFVPFGLCRLRRTPFMLS